MFEHFQVSMGASVSMLAWPARATTTHVSMEVPVSTSTHTISPSIDVTATLDIWVFTTE